jgi:redox-sensitive bicupin YhaK (pirin superfamily)
MEKRTMTSHIETDERPATIQAESAEREIALVEDAHIRPMMGNQVLESLPSRGIPYRLVDPFILVHEAVVRVTPEQASQDTRHPHRGFDNLWYAISGSSSTGHSTGPGGSTERARLEEGSLLKLRAGRGVWHAEGIGEDELREGKLGTEMRGVLFWVNLARKDKGADPTAQFVASKDVRVRREGDATVRVLVGEGSPVELGTPGVILDIELPNGGSFRTPVPSDYNGFVHMLEGEATFGANRRRAGRGQIALLAPGDALTVEDARPGTRFMLMAGKPYGETPIFNGPYVD